MLIARHPIFDDELEVIGYNLILKDYEHLFSESLFTPSQKILNALIQLDITKLTYNSLAFIPFNPTMLQDQYAEKYLPKNCVFEINKTTCQNSDLIDLLKSAFGKGYHFSYDGLEIINTYKDFLKYIKYIKIDVTKFVNIENLLSLLSSYNIVTLAKNVNTLDDFDRCKEIGFQLFQGFFICQPNIQNSEKISSSRLMVLKLISKLYEPEFKIPEIAESIQSDITLSYKLLRLINSVYYAKSIKVKSIMQAVTLLGINRIRIWASLLLLSNIVDKPNYLFYTALERAKMCETLCVTKDISKKESAFLVGLLSVIDTMFDRPMEELLSKIPLSDEVNEALLEKKGILGTILLSVISYQQGNWVEALFEGFEPEYIRNAFLGSIDWVTSVSTYV